MIESFGEDGEVQLFCEECGEAMVFDSEEEAEEFLEDSTWDIVEDEEDVIHVCPECSLMYRR